ncbi:uncharacterized protein LOC127529871 [Erpetoichthys calabaricus]|uniref:uncharacterized protein LOC127529871 n=1 Tax=Erpetoichthys calabaricus TaxID=27687 RepID=UPI00223496EB|nr:uncharacterized protein LOC127529871 [Erpetoichthys calabaricus]
MRKSRVLAQGHSGHDGEQPILCAVGTMALREFRCPEHPLRPGHGEETPEKGTNDKTLQSQMAIKRIHVDLRPALAGICAEGSSPDLLDSREAVRGPPGRQDVSLTRRTERAVWSMAVPFTQHDSSTRKLMERDVRLALPPIPEGREVRRPPCPHPRAKVSPALVNFTDRSTLGSFPKVILQQSQPSVAVEQVTNGKDVPSALPSVQDVQVPMDLFVHRVLKTTCSQEHQVLVGVLRSLRGELWDPKQQRDLPPLWQTDGDRKVTSGAKMSLKATPGPPQTKPKKGGPVKLSLQKRRPVQ